MRIRTAATAAVLALGAVLSSAGAALADPDPNVSVMGTATNSPGVLSGNVIQMPVGMPVNVCGNSVGILDLLGPAAYYLDPAAYYYACQ
ncbi:chaplin [Streptomyces sp. NPDC002004]